MNYQEYIDFACKMLEAGLPYLVEGEPGGGKTDCTTHAAVDKLGYRMIIMEPAVKSPIDFGGVPAQIRPAKGDKPAEWDYTPIGELKELVHATEPTVFMMDDFGQGTVATQNATSHLIHARRIGENQLSDHVRVCAATNRAQDKAGTNPMCEHVKSRWTTIIHLEPDVDGWLKWAMNCDDVGLRHKKVPMPKIIPAFIAWKRKPMLFNFQPKPGLENSRTPRTVHHVGQMIAAGVVDESNAYDLISRSTDKGFATEFMGFLRVWAHMPDPEEVLDNPDLLDGLTFEQYKWDEEKAAVVSVGQAPLSQRPDIGFSIVSSIYDLVTPDKMDNYVRVLEKFTKPIEGFGMLSLKHNSRDSLMQTAAFIDWATRNPSLMI